MSLRSELVALATRVPSSPYPTEEATKQFLVLPFLSRALGWRWDCPSDICPEYPIGSGRVDYALLSGEPVAFVECKVGPLGAGDTRQLLEYLRESGAPSVGVLTDGVVWKFYTVAGGEPFFQFDLRSYKQMPNPAAESALAGFARGKDISEAVATASGVGSLVAFAGTTEGRAKLEEAVVAVVRGVIAGAGGDSVAVQPERYPSDTNIFYYAGDGKRSNRRLLAKLRYWKNGQVYLWVFGTGGEQDLVRRVQLRAIVDIAGYSAEIRATAFREGV